MSIETSLLLLESVLLIVTVILLLFSLREGRGRRNLLLEVEKATKVLTRQEYFLTVTDSMMDAKSEVIGFITGRLPTGDDKKRTREIITHIERLTGRGVSVKYLLPKFHDRAHIASLYKKAGADIRLGSCPVVYDLRYIVVDSSLAVIGLPESTGEKEATRKGYRIPSEGLATILKEYFYRCWEKNMSYDEYLREVIKQTGASIKTLASELQIDEEELERLSQV
jgi:hypothetical protein